MRDIAFQSEVSTLDIPEVKEEVAHKALEECMALMEKHKITQYVIVAKFDGGSGMVLNGCKDFFSGVIAQMFGKLSSLC